MPPPVVSLGGRTVRLKPVVTITVIGPTGQDSRPILLDSGADDVVFPMPVATRLGVQLAGAPHHLASGAGARSPVGLHFAPVILELTDGVDRYRWRAQVGF